MQQDDIKSFRGGGMDSDSAPESIDANDYISAWNLRGTGTSGQQIGYETNIESTQLVSGSLLPGINNVIGGGRFNGTGQILAFRYNTAGNNQILLYDSKSGTYTVIFTDKTNSGNIPILPLDPQNEVRAVLINKTYVIWWAKGLQVGYTNIKTLSSGGYGTVLAEDISLLKPQCLFPITAAYISDNGRQANFLRGKLFQFIVQYINDDFNYSAWGTWSKRIVPTQESTPTIGTDVTQNNAIVLSVFMGSIRASTVNIACRYGLNNFNTIKTVTRAYIKSLPNVAIDVTNQIYEVYNPTTNIYSFVFYNESLNIPITPTETDLLYDYIWPANAGANINGNIVALADLSVGYPRPTTPVTVMAVAYNPNITLPVGYNNDPLRVSYTNPGGVGSGLGDHRRYIQINFLGTPNAGDNITVVLYNIQTPSSTESWTYTVQPADGHTLLTVIQHLSQAIPNSYYYQDTASAQVVLGIKGDPYYELQGVPISIFNAGLAVNKSIHAVLDNSSYQVALAHYDAFGRPFPIETDNTFVVQTQSYAKLSGLTSFISWAINNPTAPVGAASYQWLMTKNTTVIKLVDTFASVLNYIGGWDASSNTPTLTALGGATIGTTYQVTAPNSAPAFNLGNGTPPYNTGDYITYNGKSWDIIPKSFGDLTANGNIVAVSINPLSLFNQKYSNNGVSTVLGYDFTQGDRCTIHYYIDPASPTVINYLNNPALDVTVYGYDAGLFLVKIEKSSSYATSLLAGKNLFIRLYTPNTQQTSGETTDNTTVWQEIGEQFNIVNGLYTTLTGIITDGDVFFKTRFFQGVIDPNIPYEVLATDFNFSDFYPSAFTSYGRPRTFYDELEQTERKASIITSQSYILGSKKNGLTRFYPADIYGDSDGQTSSSFGGIQILWQRGNILLAIQELNIFYIPVNETYTVLNEQLTGQSISEKLLNNGRYETKGIGIGLAKESFCTRYDTGYFIDPNKSLPMEVTLGGVQPIAGKMSKYFKSILQAAYAIGKKIHLFYNDYYVEVVLCIQADGGILTLFPFSPTQWNPNDSYNIAGTDVTATPGGAHCTASYNSSTGVVTYTPTSNYVGNDTPTFTFNIPGGGIITKTNCLTWIAGTTTVNPFSFAPKTNQALNTEIQSNSITVFGNNIPVAIGITGGQYSVNGGAFTASPGMVNAGDTVVVEVLSSSSSLTSSSCTLTVSGQSSTFTATTLSNMVNPFSFTPVYNQPLSTEIQSNSITVAGNTAPVAISITGGQYQINGGAFTSSAGTVNLGDVVVVEVLSSSSNHTATSCTLTIAAQSGTFTATTIISALLVGILAVDIYSNSTINAYAYIDTMAATAAYRMPVYTGANFQPSATPAANCYIIASDFHSGSPSWRYEFNIQKLQNDYPGIDTFTLKIAGRDVSSGTIAGIYGTKSAADAVMIMTGSPGSYLPSNTGSTIAITSYSGKATVGGADGTYGIGVGADILVFTYTISTNTLTLA